MINFKFKDTNQHYSTIAWISLSTLHLLDRTVQRFRGGLVFEAHRLFHHSTLGLRVIKKKKGHVRVIRGEGAFLVRGLGARLAHYRRVTARPQRVSTKYEASGQLGQDDPASG